MCIEKERERGKRERGREKAYIFSPGSERGAVPPPPAPALLRLNTPGGEEEGELWRLKPI
jgi:hypothetical protein